MKRASWRMGMAAVVGILVFLVLPLVSWGVGNVDGFLAHPVRVAYGVVAVAVMAAALAVLPQAGRGWREGTKTVARQRIAVLLLQILGIGTVVVAPWGDGRGIGALPLGDAGRYAGLVLFAVGYGIVLWATAVLGRQFSVQVTIQEGHKLVTGGPYRWVRHPRYTGIVTFLAGYSLIFQSWMALCFVGGVAAVLAWRIHDEEGLLREQFGREWDDYARRARRVIPFLY